MFGSDMNLEKLHIQHCHAMMSHIPDWLWLDLERYYKIDGMVMMVSDDKPTFVNNF